MFGVRPWTRDTVPGAAYAGWILVVGLAVVLAAVAIPATWTDLHTPCTGICDGASLTATQARDVERSGLSLNLYASYFVTLYTLFSLVWVCLAVVIMLRRPGAPLAVLGALVLALTGIDFPGTLGILARAHPVLETPVLTLKLVSVLSLSLFFYVFPDGRFTPRWTRPAMLLATLLVVPLFWPSSPFSWDHLPGPLATVLMILWLGSIPAAQFYKYRRVSGRTERQQTKWIVFGAALALGGVVALSILGSALGVHRHKSIVLLLAGNSGFYIVMLLIPISIGIAILRYRLWEIDYLINRALVYSALSVCIVGIYILAVGYLGGVFRLKDSPIVSFGAATAVALIFNPLRVWLQRAVNRAMYGERDDPYDVVSRLGRQLESTLAPQAVFPTIVETVARSLKLPYAAIAVPEDGELRVEAAVGIRPATPVSMDVTYHGEFMGVLQLAPRPGEETFSPADRHLLAELARHAGAAAYAVRLTTDLQRSRERLVAAREEERRRLRRDLHDGLGPALAAMTMQAETARDLVADNPVRSTAMLTDLTEQLQEVTADIRRIAHDLRPPALDDLGLVPALQTYASRCEQRGLAIAVEADGIPPSLPAAVEVAAYRIVQEALTNVLRHAAASYCVVRLQGREDRLAISVEDDGRGLPEDAQVGIGLLSMRERALELGGECRIEDRPDRGAVIRAELPYGIQRRESAAAATDGNPARVVETV